MFKFLWNCTENYEKCANILFYQDISENFQSNPHVDLISIPCSKQEMYSTNFPLKIEDFLSVEEEGGHISIVSIEQ